MRPPPPTTARSTPATVSRVHVAPRAQAQPRAVAAAAAAFSVRDATAADVASLVAFNAAMALETENLVLNPTALTAGVAAVFEGDGRGARYFVAVPVDAPGAAPAACAMITTEWSDWRNAPIWWLQSVYCVPDQRRRGAFGLIYRHIRAAAADAGAAGVRLYAERGNDAAAAVYGRLGMTRDRYLVFEDMFDGH